MVLAEGDLAEEVVGARRADSGELGEGDAGGGEFAAVVELHGGVEARRGGVGGEGGEQTRGEERGEVDAAGRHRGEDARPGGESRPRR